MSPKFLMPLLVGIWLFGCVSSAPKRPCPEILASDLHALLAQSVSPEETRAKIASLYNLPLNQVEPSSGGFGWKKDGIIGNFVTEHPFILKNPPAVSIEYTNDLPTSQQILNCLGTPDSYGAWYLATPASGYAPFLIFDMYFVKQGILARVIQAGKRNQPPGLDGTNPTRNIYYVLPDSSEKTMERLTWTISTERKAKIKPWPGSWKDLVIDIEPSAR